MNPSWALRALILVLGSVFAGAGCAPKLKNAALEILDAKITDNQGAGSTISIATKMDLEVPIEMIDSGLQSFPPAGEPFAHRRSQTRLDTNEYDGIVQYSFEVVADSGTSGANVYLLDSAMAVMATIVLPPSQFQVRYRIPFTPHLGSWIYLIGMPRAPGIRVTAARLVVQQTGATKTSVYVPLLSDDVLNSSVESMLPPTAVTTYAGLAYGTNSDRFFPLWHKDLSRLSLAPGAAYRLETIIGTTGSGGAGPLKVALFNNAGVGTLVAGSEISVDPTALNGVTYLEKSFGEDTSFPDLADYGVRMATGSAQQPLFIHKAGLRIALQGLAKAEVYYRVSRSQSLSGVASILDLTDSRILFNSSAFKGPTCIFQVTGRDDGAANPIEVVLRTAGPSDSSGGITDISSSGITFGNLSKSAVRSGPLALVPGDRLLVFTRPIPGQLDISESLLIVRP